MFRHSVQDPIWHTCILSIVGTNIDLKRHLIYSILDYRQHLGTWHLSPSIYDSPLILRLIQVKLLLFQSMLKYDSKNHFVSQMC
jgi:hypothetical protein